VHLSSQRVLGIKRIQAPQLVRRSQRNLVVPDDQLHRRLGCTGDQQAIITGALELGAPVMTDVGACVPVEGIGLWTKAGDAHAARVGGASARQSARHQDKRVLRGKGIQRVRALIPGEASGHSASTDIVRDVFLERLRTDPAG